MYGLVLTSDKSITNITMENFPSKVYANKAETEFSFEFSSSCSTMHKHKTTSV